MGIGSRTKAFVAKTWADPVGSKVIATAICGVPALFVGSIIYFQSQANPPGPPPGLDLVQRPLDLRFFSMGGINPHTIDTPFGEELIVDLQLTELVNRSSRNMSLKFILFVRLYDKSGNRTGNMAVGEWRNDLFSKQSVEVVNVERESTKSGVLIFRFPVSGRPDGVAWDDYKREMMILKLEESVTGSYDWANPSGVYPPSSPGGFAEVK